MSDLRALLMRCTQQHARQDLAAAAHALLAPYPDLWRAFEQEFLRPVAPSLRASGMGEAAGAVRLQ